MTETHAEETSARFRSLVGTLSRYRVSTRHYPYRKSIQTVLQKHNQHSPKNRGDVENELLFDVERDRYQLMCIGWQEMKRVYHTTMHFDIKDGKIWIQQNMTDIDVGQKLVDLGVSKEDIILGLHPPYKRPHTGYGVA